ncbi:MAG: glycosyltransferase [Candidatus Microgenomates bacterium]
MRAKMYKIVDVVIPTYNSSKYIIEAIESVIRQGDIVNKIYVVDDGSTDSTHDIVARLADSDERIIYVYQTNKGPSAARNAGIKLCNSPYVAFLDSDDIWLKNKLLKQIRVFNNTRFKNLGVVYGSYIDMDESGNILKKFSSFKLNKKIRGKVTNWLINKNCIAGSDSAVLIKRECFNNVGLFDENLGACEDWDMWLRISKYYEFDYVNSPIACLRRHKREIQNNEKTMIVNTITFMRKIKSLGYNITDIQRNNIRSSAYYYLLTHVHDFKILKYLTNPKISSLLEINAYTFTKWLIDQLYKKLNIAKYRNYYSWIVSLEKKNLS